MFDPDNNDVEEKNSIGETGDVFHYQCPETGVDVGLNMNPHSTIYLRMSLIST